MNGDTAQMPKRFYTSASVEPVGDAYAVQLDGRSVKTPAGAVLALPSHTLAREIAGEWDRQGDRLDIHSMHLTRLANVAIDRTPDTRSQLADTVRQYCETDLTCFLAIESDVRKRQEALWRPWRTWAGQTLNIVLLPVEGLIATPQPQASLDAAHRYASDQDDFALTGLAFGCGLYGSAVLAIAVAEQALSAEDAFTASIIDETLQMEQWGEDAEALAAQTAKRAESDAIGTWFVSLSN